MLQVFYDKKFHQLEPQNQGYLLYFGHNIKANEMLNSDPSKYTRASWNYNKLSYDNETLAEFGYQGKEVEWSSAINWAKPTKLPIGKKFYDFDLTSAYPNFLLDYKAKRLGVLVGKEKRYHHFTAQIPENSNYVWVYKVSFNIYNDDLHNTRFFRRWISDSALKRARIMDTGFSMSGIIYLPTGNNMTIYDKFIEDLNYYGGEAILEAVIETYGDPDYIYINDTNIAYDLKCKNDKNYNQEAKDRIKLRLNSSTGWLNNVDPIFYSTMVNYVKLQAILMDDFITQNDIGEVVGSNTDGVTVISDDSSMFTLFHVVNDLNILEEYLDEPLMEYHNHFTMTSGWRIKNPRTEVKFTERRIK